MPSFRVSFRRGQRLFRAFGTLAFRWYNSSTTSLDRPHVSRTEARKYNGPEWGNVSNKNELNEFVEDTSIQEHSGRTTEGNCVSLIIGKSTQENCTERKMKYRTSVKNLQCMYSHLVAHKVLSWKLLRRNMFDYYV